MFELWIGTCIGSVLTTLLWAIYDRRKLARTLAENLEHDKRAAVDYHAHMIVDAICPTYAACFPYLPREHIEEIAEPVMVLARLAKPVLDYEAEDWDTDIRALQNAVRVSVGEIQAMYGSRITMH